MLREGCNDSDGGDDEDNHDDDYDHDNHDDDDFRMTDRKTGGASDTLDAT